MSRIYETLRQMEMQRAKSDPVRIESLQPVDLVNSAMMEPAEIEATSTAKVAITLKTRLVSLTDPRGLGAEKFRALVTRLENQRKDRDLKSFQITSAVVNEGKSLVSANLAVTLAKHTGSRVLLVEGDLHRPMLATLFGLGQLEGIGHWWSARDEKERISRYIYRLNEIPLWFLGAGATSDHPSQILQSARFAETFSRMSNWFDWVVIDSIPMLPMVDSNLWSRLVDGTLVVVREGVTPIHALKKGFESLDNPKLVGIVLNEASEFDRTNYTDQYYALNRAEGPVQGNRLK
jgi:capsular exopolysaccharide synthesis family protein